MAHRCRHGQRGQPEALIGSGRAKLRRLGRRAGQRSFGTRYLCSEPRNSTLSLGFGGPKRSKTGRYLIREAIIEDRPSRFAKLSSEVPLHFLLVH
jgi:hypothetical protein